MSLLRQAVGLSAPSGRRSNYILYFLNAVTNRWVSKSISSLFPSSNRSLANHEVDRHSSVNQNRVKEVGSDCAAAEWLVRNGSSVRWRDSTQMQNDFGALPSQQFDRYQIEEIDARNSSIMDVGFQHLGKSAALRSTSAIRNQPLHHLDFRF